MKKIILNTRPSGMVSEASFKITEDDMPKPEKDELLLKAKYISVDPYMRNRMNNVESYVKPFELNEPLNGDVIAEVVESNIPGFAPGDLVTGHLPWQEYTSISPSKVDRIEVDENISSTEYLGSLGLTGLTAYFGLLDIGAPQEGETVVISGAAGAVGSVAGQIAKLKGCTVFGIAGSDQKCAYLENELGFDGTINYKNSPNIRKALRKISPEKVDIYFDNVGGDISDGVFYLLNNFSRIVLCGQIALYNLNRLSMGPRLFPQFLIRRTKIQGFIVYDYSAQFEQARSQLKEWLVEGKIKSRETIIDGFENIPQALLGLFSGDNIGKQIVRLG
jgi:NADPH-dependent curcumin reductase CurA